MSTSHQADHNSLEAECLTNFPLCFYYSDHHIIFLFTNLPEDLILSNWHSDFLQFHQHLRSPNWKLKFFSNTRTTGLMDLKPLSLFSPISYLTREDPHHQRLMSRFLLPPHLCSSGTLSNLPIADYLHLLWCHFLLSTLHCFLIHTLVLFLLIPSCSKNGAPPVGDVILFDSSSLEGSLMEDWRWKGQKLSQPGKLTLHRSEVTWIF